jgi:dienelactone hydrolase
MDIRAIPVSSKATAPAETNRPFLRFKFFWIVVLLILLLVAGIYSLRYELRSYVFLNQFLDPHASGLLVQLEGHGLDIQEVTLNTTQGPVRARLYVPRGVAHPPGMVLVHGIHHLGIDEPRLMNFARAAASDGFSVLTPEIAALADYHVDSASIGTIGESTAWLQQQLGTGPVTVVGVSFAGGLSLLAACDPRYAPHIRALVLMGAYDNLGRVARFLATSQAEFPDGHMEPYAAHDYGAAVFVYSHLDQFFPAPDLDVAHDALRDWLWERPSDAQALLPHLSLPSRATMEILLARQIDRLRPKLLDAIQADDSQLSAISPEGKLGALHALVFIVHGATTNRAHQVISWVGSKNLKLW